MPAEPRPDGVRTLEVGGIDVANTLQMIAIYASDPTFRKTNRELVKAVLTPDGPGTIRLRWTPPEAGVRDGGRGGDGPGGRPDGSTGRNGGTVGVETWGAGAGWLLDRAPYWVGLCDDPTGFDPTLHPRVHQWWRRHGNVRLAASGVIWQELVLVLLGQRVTTTEAAKSWNRMCRTWGTPAPGPADVVLPPTPEVVAGLSSADLHRINVERRRAEAILLAARRADRLEEAATMAPPDAIGRLSALPGLGIWTATGTVLACHGDPDTILLRDYGMPTLVNYAFTGETRHLDPDAGGDEIMCGHLEPWRGHRQRIIRMLFAAGITAPRRGPRARNPDIRRL